MKLLSRCLLFLPLVVSTLFAQTLNYTGDNTIIGSLLAGGSTRSSPFKLGLLSARPSTCTVGDAYFSTDAAAGGNLSGCTSTNTWTNLGSSLNGLTITPTTGTFTLTNGKTLAITNTIAFTGTDGTTITLPTSSATMATLGLTNTFTGRQDASGAASTAPAKVGTTAPGTCTVGDTFFDSDATAGQNWLGCTATNTWTLMSGSGVVSQFTATRTNSTTLLVAAECTTSTPCNMRQLNTEWAVTASCNPVISTGTGTIYVYVNAGAITVGHNGLTFTSSTGCTLASSITAFPSGTIPLWTWPATGGAWDTTGQVDYRALFFAPPSTGEGIAYSGASVTVDRTTIPRYFTAAGAPSGAVGSSRRGDFYINSTTGELYSCNNAASDCSGVNSSNWVLAGGGSSFSTVGTIDLDTGGCGSVAATSNGWNHALSMASTSGRCYPYMINTGSPSMFHKFTMPADFNSAGSIDVQLSVTLVNGGTGNYNVKASLARITDATNLTTVAYLTASNTGDIAVPAQHLSNTTTMTGLTKTSIAARDRVQILIERDNTIASNYADVLGINNVTIFYTRQ